MKHGCHCNSYRPYVILSIGCFKFSIYLPLVSTIAKDTWKPKSLVSKETLESQFLESLKRIEDKIENVIQINDESCESHLNQVVRSYKGNFTVHGMSRVVTGHPIERIVWLGLLISCLLFVGRESFYFYKYYRRYEVTEVRMTTVKNITLPAMTICSKNPYEIIMSEVCWENMSLHSYYDCVPCNKTEPLFNSLFLGDDKDVVPHPLYAACLIINSRSRITTQTPWNERRITFNRLSTNLYLHIHDKDDISFPLHYDLGRPDAVFSAGNYDVTFKNIKIFNRLKHPYPSRCTDGSNTNNAFGGKFSTNKCKDTCSLLQQLETCNTTIDYWKQYIINVNKSATYGLQFVNDKQKKDTACNKKIQKCLFSVLESLALENKCRCAPSCSEETFETTTTWERNIDNMISLRFSASNTLTSITEIPAYPANKFITDIGGWLSLFSGMSILSVAEIIIFAVLSIVALSKRK